MRLLTLLFIACISAFANAQNCPDCKTTFHNYTGDIHVKNNENICLTGTYSGNIELNGGKLNVCGTANIGVINYKQPASVTYSKGAIVKIQSVSSNKETFMTNYSDSLVILGGNFNQPFKLINKGTAYIQGGNFNNKFEFINEGRMIVNTNLMVNTPGSEITNTKYFEINGNFTSNISEFIFNNSCQFRVNGDFTSNGAIINLNEGVMKVNNCLMNGGAIILKEASIFSVNNLSLNGYIEGIGARSKFICQQNPNINGNPGVKGEVSLCVKTGSYTPNPGVIQAPAMVDCEYAIGLTSCNPMETASYSYFRLLSAGEDWKSPSSWEVWDTKTGQWILPPSGTYPTKGSSVIIDGDHEMTLENSNEVRSLYLGSQAGPGKLIFQPGVTLTITDSVSQSQTSIIELNNGTFNINGHLLSDLNMKGSANAIININVATTDKNLLMDQSEPGTSNTLYSLTINNPSGKITLTDTLIIGGILNPTSGAIHTNDKLVLRSNASKTASVSPGIGNYIVGKVTMQRYIPEIARRFRFVSPTIKNATLLDWQDDIFITGNNIAGSATGQQIGTFNSAGFDANQNFSTTIYTYDEAKTGLQNNGWVNGTNETNTLADFPLPAGKGYRVFIRGDRSDTNRLNDQNPVQNEVTLDMFGELITGDVTVPITYTNTGKPSEDGWNLIGNPYASAFDWTSFYEDNNLSGQFEPTIWVYDSRTNAYISYNVLAKAGSFTNGIVPSGQSFWVKATVPNATITLKEKYKIEGVENDEIRDLPGPTRTDEVSIRLIKDNINEDEMIVKYINGSLKGVDSFDIDKFWSDAVGIAQYVEGDEAYLDLSCRPVDYSAADMVPIYYFVNESGDYSLNMKMSAAKIYQGPKAYLLDTELKKYIDIAEQPIYNFTVNLPNPANGQADRFYLVYFPSTPPASLLNYLFVERQDTTGVNLTWGSLNEPLPTTYLVQRGYSSGSFTTIGTITGVGGFDESSDYELLDTAADLRRDLYYRVGSKDSVNTQITYSPVIYLPYNNTGLNHQSRGLKDQLLVYPVPAQNTLTLEYHDMAFHGALNITMFDITGKEVLATKLEEPMPGSTKLQLDISALNNGLYFMQLANINGETMRVKIIKTN
jgi:hypothetical protein